MNSYLVGLGVISTKISHAGLNNETQRQTKNTMTLVNKIYIILHKINIKQKGKNKTKIYYMSFS